MSVHEKNNNLSEFSSKEEEIAFLKGKLEETRAEFIEFQESSRELETEYETQIKQLEKKNNEYAHLVNRMETEYEQLRVKHNVCVNDTQHKLNENQQQIAELTALNNRLTSYIRELEQNNDDLERAQRALAASLEDFEGQLNQQIERNALLENEVSKKEELECVVQRLKEEARDLRHELIANKNSNESARRKQLIIDNDISTSLTDACLQPTSPKLVNSMQTKCDLGHQNSNSHADKTTAQGSGQRDIINVRDRVSMVDSTTSPTQSPTHISFSSPISSNRSPETQVSSDSKSQQTSPLSSPTLPPSMVMSPSSRISALDIVSNLLRKVGSLESKLAAARKVTN